MPATAKPAHSITVDLTWNRLGNIQEEHLMLLCDTLCDNPWLRVRLGAEVMVPCVMAALRQKEMTDMWDTQLIVDRPWEHPSARKLAESMADLQRSTAAMTAGVQRSTATLSELATKWDKALGGFQGHIKKTATALESELVQAVRGQLDDSQVLGLSYNWQEVRQSMAGDIDGLVVGWLRGDSRQQVVVVCEAKYDMKKEWKDAADQVQQNKTRLLDIWDADVLDGHSAKDADALKLMEFKGLPVMAALGGSVFPEDMTSNVNESYDRAVAVRQEVIYPTSMGRSKVNVVDAATAARGVSVCDWFFFAAEILTAVAGTVVAVAALIKSPRIESVAALVVATFAVVKATKSTLDKILSFRVKPAP
eukprot:gene3628-13711_t